VVGWDREQLVSAGSDMRPASHKDCVNQAGLSHVELLVAGGGSVHVHANTKKVV
jgi:hypothetical protein